MKPPVFKSPQEDPQKDFAKVLRNRVQIYLKDREYSSKGGFYMILKSILALLLLFVPYFFMLWGTFSSSYSYMGLYAIMGLGMAAIGLNIMHDANHESYAKKKWLNNLMGKSLNLIGGNATLWKIQHNVLHHTYTNIDGSDEDLDCPNFLRFSQFQNRIFLHKFQFIYAWFLYGFASIARLFIKEFDQLNRYNKMGLLPKGKAYKIFVAELIGWKIFCLTYALIIPILVLPIAWYVTLGFFFIGLFITGFILSIIFQTAHVMPQCNFDKMDEEGKIEKNWAVHQMQTTCDYATENKFFSYLVGGLNFQVVHHLFPNISHRHYFDISKIVAETAKEFKIPYLKYNTFRGAIWGHGKMLYNLGR